jgi:hypothetical protein
MIEYNIIVHLIDDSKITIPVKYDKIYDLRRDVTNMGTNGIMQELNDRLLYHPPHKINKIEIIKN